MRGIGECVLSIEGVVSSVKPYPHHQVKYILLRYMQTLFMYSEPAWQYAVTCRAGLEAATWHNMTRPTTRASQATRKRAHRTGRWHV